MPSSAAWVSIDVAQRAVAGQHHAQPRLGARGDRERAQLGRIVLLLDQPADAADQHGVAVAPSWARSAAISSRGDRAIRREIDAVADRVHPAAQRPVDRAGASGPAASAVNRQNRSPSSSDTATT